MDVIKELPNKVEIAIQMGIFVHKRLSMIECLPIARNARILDITVKIEFYQEEGGSKWVPRSNGDITMTALGLISSDPILLVDPRPPSDHVMVVELSIEPLVTLVVTLVGQHQKDPEMEKVWKVVTRKSKDNGKHIAFHNAKVVNYAN